MRISWPLIAGLAALTLPRPIAIVALAVPLIARAGVLGWCGVLLLIGSRFPVAPRAPWPQAASSAFGVSLDGTWRAPLGASPWLATDAGRVAVETSVDLVAPQPGAPISALCRVTPEGAARIVDISPRGPVSGAWRDRAGRYARSRVRRLVRGPGKGLLTALLLGDKSDLDGATITHFKRTGTMHLLALSGLHVGLLAGLLAPFASGVATCGLLVVFVALVGPRAPLLRALAMRTLGGLLVARGRRGLPLARLMATALGLGVVLGPALLASLSARLSFLAVGGLLAGITLCGRRRWLAGALGPAGAVLATAPLCVATFGEFQPLGIVVTPLVLPFIVALLAVGAPAVWGGALLAGLDPVTSPILESLSGGLLFGMEWLSEHVPAPLTPQPPGLDPTLLGIVIVWALADLGRIATKP